MRFPVNTVKGLAGATLGVMLAGCSGGIADIIGTGNDRPVAMPLPSTGPAADYPVIIGEPYRIDGVLYEPVDVMNYDEVGYLTAGPGAGVTAAHKTLPLPSYVEVTSLDTGKTILARVERRGPMDNGHILALSPDAIAQLEVDETTAVRVRRVNPPEMDRAALRQGGRAPVRMDTPMSLVGVLRRKLDESAPPLASPQRVEVAPSTAAAGDEPTAVQPTPTVDTAEETSATEESASEPTSPSATEASDRFSVQAASFSTRERADRAAEALGGFVQPSGRYFRVRTGPFPSEQAAEASLAKVRAAGYSDARVVETN